MKGNFLGDCLCSLMCAGVFLAGCTVVLVTAFPIVQIAVGAVYMYECPVAPMIPVYVMVCGIWALLMMSLFALPKLLGSNTAGPATRAWTLWVTSLVLLFFIWFIYGSYHVYAVYPPNYHKNATDPKTKSSAVSTHTQQNTGFYAMLKNHTQKHSLPDLYPQKQTWMESRNHTSVKLFGALAAANREVTTEDVSPPQSGRLMDAVPHCDRTLYTFAFWTTTLVYAFAGNVLIMIICFCGCVKLANKVVQLLP